VPIAVILVKTLLGTGLWDACQCSVWEDREIWIMKKIAMEWMMLFFILVLLCLDCLQNFLLNYLIAKEIPKKNFVIIDFLSISYNLDMHKLNSFFQNLCEISQKFCSKFARNSAK